MVMELRAKTPTGIIYIDDETFYAQINDDDDCPVSIMPIKF